VTSNINITVILFLPAVWYLYTRIKQRDSGSYNKNDNVYLKSLSYKQVLFKLETNVQQNNFFS